MIRDITSFIPVRRGLPLNAPEFVRQTAPNAEWLNKMKSKLKLTTCVLALTLATASSSFGSEDAGMLMITDVLLVRPACFAATAIGSVFFVVSLPIAAISRSTKKTAHALVVVPAQATFTRPLGDMEALQDY
jgi:hypothetical protein